MSPDRMNRNTKRNSKMNPKMNRLKLLVPALLLAAAQTVLAAGTPAQLYKNPDCFCCELYAKYLTTHGYEVEVIPTHDLPLVKEEHKVPGELEGCHTTLIQGYAFEGHIPVASIDKVLKERPKIRGLSVPGMPAGSPGMAGEKKEPLKVYVLEDAAKPRVYAVH